MAELWWRETWKEAIYDSSLSTTCRFVALVYAEHARDSRTAWAPISVLVRKTGLSRRSVINARNQLRDAGWLAEVKAADRRSSAHFLLVIPEGAGVQEVHPTEESGVQEVHSGVQDVHLRGAGGAPNQSFINPHQSSLSPEQLLVKDLLDLDEGDERLMKISSILQANNVRSPKPWLRKCHENGELLDLLQAETGTSGWGEPEDDSYMQNPGYVEGWGLPERVKVEDYYLSRIVGLGYDEEQARAYLAKAVEIYPTGTERKCWHEAYMTALNDTRCDECGCNPGNHSPICSQAPEQQDRAAS